jgi:hypothetical protein
MTDALSTLATVQRRHCEPASMVVAASITDRESRSSLATTRPSTSCRRSAAKAASSPGGMGGHAEVAGLGVSEPRGESSWRRGRLTRSVGLRSTRPRSRAAAKSRRRQRGAAPGWPGDHQRL